jgi:competence protein ComEC
VIKDIFFTKPMFLGILVVVFLFVVMMREFKAKQISGFLVASLTFTLIVIYEIAAIEQKSEVVIFHRPRATVLGVKQGYKLQIYSDSATVSTDEYWLKNYNLLNRIKSIEIKPLANTYKIGDKRLIRIDSSGFYTSEIKSDVILLSESPDIHLGKLIKQLNPKQIIVDGNNYRSYVERWQKTAEELDISFHNTYSDGFVRFNLP